MSAKKEIIIINNYKGDRLGIKIILATNTKTNENFAIVTDVNPSSQCYPDDLTIGDVIVSLNGMEINSLNALNDVVRYVSEKNSISIQMSVIKKGALDGSNLIQRCLNSPCTELCEIWHETEVQKKKSIELLDRSLITNDNVQYTLKAAKPVSVDETLRRLQKMSSASTEESLLSGKQPVSSQSKVTYHQKALPMKMKNKKNEVSVTHHKSRQTPARDMIASPKPHFIKRPSARDYDKSSELAKLKQAKSCTNLTDSSMFSLNVKTLNASSSSSETVSTSSDSTNSPVFAPRKASLPNNEIPTKPVPLPRSKHINLEPNEFFSLQATTDMRTESHGPPIVCSKPTQKTLNPPHPPKIEQQKIQTNKFGHLNSGFQSLSAANQNSFDGTNTYRH